MPRSGVPMEGKRFVRSGDLSVVYIHVIEVVLERCSTQEAIAASALMALVLWPTARPKWCSQPVSVCEDADNEERP